MSQSGVTELADTCWVVTEGTVGMENQALGLAERLALPAVVKRVKLAPPWRWLAPQSFGNPIRQMTSDSTRLTPPWPRLVIGCGRQSIPAVIAIKRASGGRTITVQCQHPRVDPANFDLVIPPEHDGLTGANVLPILGSPNRIARERLAEARKQFASLFEPLRTPRLGVLVGGPSRAYTFGTPEAERLGSALAALSDEITPMVLVSRRTGDANIACINDALSGTRAWIWDGTGENPYLGALAWADAFLVTADSVNMACDAATTGKPVHIFPLPGGSQKFTMFHDSMQKRGISRMFRGRIEQWDYAPLDETGRAAARIKTLLDPKHPALDMKP